jgi:hypothetical protein
MKLHLVPNVGEHNKSVSLSERRGQVTEPHEIEQSQFEPVGAMTRVEG